MFDEPRAMVRVRPRWEVPRSIFTRVFIVVFGLCRPHEGAYCGDRDCRGKVTEGVSFFWIRAEVRDGEV